MTTILFCPVTFNLAETTRAIEVARALSPGLRAVFLGYEVDFAHLIADAGFEYVQGEPVLTDEGREQLIALDQGRGIRSPLTKEFVGRRVAVERSLIRRLGASAVVIGSNLTSLISARAEHVPLFFPVPFGLTTPQVEHTPHLGLVAGRGRLAHAADRVASGLLRLAYTRLPLAPRALATVARANGAPPVRTLAGLFEADWNLLTVMPWELVGYTLPDHYVRVGPIFAHLDAPLPPIVEELAAASEPLLYLGLGSSAGRDLALATARALGTLPINIVAPIRHYLEPGDEVPDNVQVTDLVPAHRLGGLVDAAVLHGGQGTVQTACATGVPFVGMGLQPEQTWNVRLCEQQGNAIGLSPRDAGTPRFIDAVNRLLSQPSFRTAADRVREAYAKEDGAAASARFIEARIQLGSA